MLEWSSARDGRFCCPGQLGLAKRPTRLRSCPYRSPRVLGSSVPGKAPVHQRAWEHVLRVKAAPEVHSKHHCKAMKARPSGAALKLELVPARVKFHEFICFFGGRKRSMDLRPILFLQRCRCRSYSEIYLTTKNVPRSFRARRLPPLHHVRRRCLRTRPWLAPLGGAGRGEATLEPGRAWRGLRELGGCVLSRVMSPES